MVSNGKVVGSMSDWYNELRETIVHLSGVDVKSFGADAVSFIINYNNTVHTVDIKFKNNTTDIQSVQVSY